MLNILCFCYQTHSGAYARVIHGANRGEKKHPNVHFGFISQCIPQNSWYTFKNIQKTSQNVHQKPVLVQTTTMVSKKKLVLGEKINIHGISKYMKSSMKYHKIMMTVIMHGYKLFVNLSPQAHPYMHMRTPGKQIWKQTVPTHFHINFQHIKNDVGVVN